MKRLKYIMILILGITTATLNSSYAANKAGDCGAGEDMVMEMPASHPHPMGNGTTTSAVGYSLEILKRPVFGQSNIFSYRITNKGKAVTSFTLDMGKLSHLIVYSSDYREYIHTHPTVDKNGVFSTDLPLKRKGSYGVVVDTSVPLKDKSVNPAIQLELGSKFDFGGKTPFVKATQPKCNFTSNGYKIALSNTSVKSSHGTLMVTITDLKNNPVSFGQFLGARAHLVVIKDSDQSYAHFHPMNEDGSMPAMWGKDVDVSKVNTSAFTSGRDDIKNKTDMMPGMLHFMTEPPGKGRYTAFLQFVDKGVLKTVSFTIEGIV